MVIESLDMATPLDGDVMRVADVRVVAMLWDAERAGPVDSTETLRQMLTDESVRVDYLVARGEDRGIIGAVSVVSRGEPVALIDSVAVLPEHRHQGVGSMLIAAAIDACFSTPTGLIMVNGVPAARPLLESLGFVTDEPDPTTNATMYLYR